MKRPWQIYAAMVLCAPAAVLVIAGRNSTFYFCIGVFLCMLSGALVRSGQASRMSPGIMLARQNDRSLDRWFLGLTVLSAVLLIVTITGYGVMRSEIAHDAQSLSHLHAFFAIGLSDIVVWAFFVGFCSIHFPEFLGWVKHTTGRKADS